MNTTIIDKELDISPSCKLAYYIYGEPAVNSDVTLEYIEYACDHWSSDTSTDIYLTKEKAIEIIEFLQEAFNLEDGD